MPTPVHVRTTIRNTVASALTGLTTTGSHVFKSRMHPQAEANLPCLLVITNDEPEIMEGDGSPQTLERHLDVQVKGIVKASSNLDETLDKIALEVETAMSVLALTGAIKALSFQSINVGMDDSLDKPVGVIALNYRITYYTVAGVPGAAI